MYISKALIKTSTHAAHITVDESGLITILKYNNYCCDMDQFMDRFDAADYIIEPLPETYYSVSFDGEDPEE